MRNQDLHLNPAVTRLPHRSVSVESMGKRSQNDKSIETENKLVIAKGMDGVGRAVGKTMNGQHKENLCGNGTVLYLDCAFFNPSLFKN